MGAKYTTSLRTWSAQNSKLDKTEKNMTEEMEYFHIEDFPNEILENIFLNLEGRYLIKTCRFVCKRWRDIVDLQTLWSLKCEKSGIHKPPINIKTDYRICYFFNPYGRNLLKNGNASEQFKHWKITANGGNRFKVEDNNCPGAHAISSIGLDDVHHCWVTSYHTCSKEQTIDLMGVHCDTTVLDEIKPNIVVSEWTTARTDCTSTYVLKVEFLSGRHVVLDSCRIENDHMRGGNWTEIKHIFKDYPSGVRYIRFIHEGHDDQFWAGHYGSKFTGASVTFQFDETNN